MKINIFKYFIVTVAAMSMVCSCDRHSIETPQEDTLSAIGFSNVSTKATLDDIQKDGFGVWASISNATVTNSLIMDNTEVTYNSTEDSWKYSPLRYWVPKTMFNFIATYPYDQDEEYYKFDPENSAVKLTVNETPSEKDFLMATNMTDTSVEGFSETVNLQFKHLLTSVSLNIWKDNVHNQDQMRITYVTLGNIRKSGTYSSNEDKWSPTNEKITLEKIYENFSDSDDIGSARVNTDGTLTPGVDDDPAKPLTDQLLIPQTIDASNKVLLKINYQLWRDTGDDTDPDATKNWEDAELEAYLPYGTWEPNKRYTYNVVLSSVKNITFYYIQTKISPWGAPQVGGTIIIK